MNYPSVPVSKTHTWTVKRSNKVESSRHVVIGFQKNNKRSNVKEDMSFFEQFTSL